MLCACIIKSINVVFAEILDDFMAQQAYLWLVFFVLDIVYSLLWKYLFVFRLCYLFFCFSAFCELNVFIKICTYTICSQIKYSQRDIILVLLIMRSRSQASRATAWHQSMHIMNFFEVDSLLHFWSNVAVHWIQIWVLKPKMKWMWVSAILQGWNGRHWHRDCSYSVN